MCYKQSCTCHGRRQEASKQVTSHRKNPQCCMEGCWSHLPDFCGNGFSRVKNTVCEQTPICPQNMARLWAGTTKSGLESSQKEQKPRQGTARGCHRLGIFQIKISQMPSWKMLLPWMQAADPNMEMGSDSWAAGLQDQCPLLVPALGNETPKISTVLAHGRAQRR